MSANTKIEWADHTFNPWIGCTKVGPGCDHCYAEADFDKRRHVVTWGAGQPRKRTAPSTWAQPLRWNAEAKRLGIRYRVFCASLADWADNAVPIEWLVDLLELVRTTPHLNWLLLTKRIGNVEPRLHQANAYVVEHWPAVDAAPLSQWLTDWLEGDTPPSNVWIGATICNQPEADRDIVKLLAVPAAKRFLSMEPLLGPVNLWLPTRKWTNSAGGTECDHCCNGDRCDDPTHHERGRLEWAVRCPYCRGTGRGKPIDWVIVGGESGTNARPMHPDWARSLRDQCQAGGVPFLFKQWGEWMPTINEGNTVKLVFEAGAPHGPAQPEFYEWPDGTGSARVGKKAAGRLLDGREWNGVPA